MVGGFAETISLMVGFNNLLGIALIFYVLSTVLTRSAPAGAAAAAA